MARIPHHIHAPGRDPCPWCLHDNITLYPDSKHVYNGKDYGPVWQCDNCGAYVGCHPGTNKALGIVAHKELREWKQKAHAAFDPLWKWKMKYKRDRGARKKAYKWLAEQMGLDREECRIGYMSVNQCKQVVEICEPIKRKLRWP